jgi:hypothetical protein
MAAGEQELGSSVANQTLATGEAFESELDGSKAEPAANHRDPVGEDGEGQRMDCCDAQRLDRDLEAGSRAGAARDLVRTGDSGALLQRLDSSAEGPAG